MIARLALGLAVVGVLCAGGAPARAQRPRVRLVEPLPEGVHARIVGQTADLPWQLERAASEEAAGARALIEVVEHERGFTLRLFDARTAHWSEREFAFEDGVAERLARSTALEALALAVRASLRALAADDAREKAATAEEREGRTRSAGEGVVAEDEGVVVEDEQEDEHVHVHEHVHEYATGGAVRFLLGGGWRGSYSRVAQHGPWVRVGMRLGALEVGVEAAAALEADLSDALTRVQIAQQHASAVLGWYVAGSEAVQLSFTARAGVVRFTRSTEHVRPDSGLVASGPDTTFSLALGLHGRVALTLWAWNGGALALELSAGALFVPAAPRLRYDGPRGRKERALWAVQPDARLGPTLEVTL